MKEFSRTASEFEAAIAATRREVVEAETMLLRSLASLRASLTALEEENRQLRLTIVKHQVQIFTESELAERLKVSSRQIARLRLIGKIEPIMVGDAIRYSSHHLERIDEIFSAKAAKAAHGRRRTGGLHEVPRRARV